MIRDILAIAGRPGLFRLVSQGKNMLIVEQLATGKRVPAYARDKVSSLADISIYTTDGEDRPLGVVLEAVKAKEEGKPVDVKGMDNNGLRAYFAEVLPEFDDERVYTADVRKLLSWYNILVEAGITEFVEAETEESAEEETSEDNTKE